MKSAEKYTAPAIWLHWIVAGLIILAVVTGWLANWLPSHAVRPIIDSHKSLGLLVIGFAVLRLLWRVGHTPPPLPQSFSLVEQRAAKCLHLALYGLMLLLPISGYLHDSAFQLASQHPLKIFWIIPVPRLSAISQLSAPLKKVFHDRMFAVHVWFGFVFYGLFAVHILGTLKHQIVDRYPELQRMWFGSQIRARPE